jgi:hypothetical protein
MLANTEGIDVESSLEDIRELVGGNIPENHKKEIITDNLNFNWDGTPGFHDAAYGRYNNQKDALVFLWKESDQLVKELHDMTSSSYSRSASKIAALVKKYIDVYGAWERIVEKDPAKYADFGQEMQRFLGSHQTVAESFLMKAIEKIDGEKGVQEFIDSLGDKNGFGYSEGYSIRIGNENGKPVINVSFKDKSWTLTPEVVEQIASEA